MAKAKLIENLDCYAKAPAGIALVLSTRFDEVLEYREAALNFEDPIGIHDMRVASRRLRSAWRDFSPYLRIKAFGECGPAIKEIADALGRVRDEDVAVEALKNLATTAPQNLLLGVDLLISERSLERNPLRSHLQQVISIEALASLRENFNIGLRDGIRNSAKNSDGAEISFADLGRQILKAGIDDFEKQFPKVFDPLDANRLHKLRITAKRLRYAMELFSQCLSGELESTAKKLARLQGALGDLHDSDLWIARTGTDLRNMANEPTAATARTVATSARIWLLGELVKIRARQYNDALSAADELWEYMDMLKSEQFLAA